MTPRRKRPESGLGSSLSEGGRSPTGYWHTVVGGGSGRVSPASGSPDAIQHGSDTDLICQSMIVPAPFVVHVTGLGAGWAIMVLRSDDDPEFASPTGTARLGHAAQCSQVGHRAVESCRAAKNWQSSESGTWSSA